jgi:hypothetical protein
MANQYRNTQKSNLSPVIERFVECAREVIRSRGEFFVLNSPKSGLLKEIIALDQWFVFENEIRRCVRHLPTYALNHERIPMIGHRYCAGGRAGSPPPRTRTHSRAGH